MAPAGIRSTCWRRATSVSWLETRSASVRLPAEPCGTCRDEVAAYARVVEQCLDDHHLADGCTDHQRVGGEDRRCRLWKDMS